MPGYTHLQRAQPVYLGHHLLAYFWMLERDARRFAAARGGRRRACRSAPARSPGSTGSSTASATAARARLRRARRRTRSTRSRTATSCSTTSYAASICATHLSRLGAEIVLWSSEEFGFCEPADDFSSGSSIMPQKKNPDAAELLRAKAPRVAGVAADARRRPARAAARLLQGPPGGQGGAVRRRRHPRALPRGGGADARRA